MPASALATRATTGARPLIRRCSQSLQRRRHRRFSEAMNDTFFRAPVAVLSRASSCEPTNGRRAAPAARFRPPCTTPRCASVLTGIEENQAGRFDSAASMLRVLRTTECLFGSHHLRRRSSGGDEELSPRPPPPKGPRTRRVPPLLRHARAVTFLRHDGRAPAAFSRSSRHPSSLRRPALLPSASSRGPASPPASRTPWSVPIPWRRKPLGSPPPLVVPPSDSAAAWRRRLHAPPRRFFINVVGSPLFFPAQGASLWNLSRMPRAPGSLLRHWRADVANVTAPVVRAESLFADSGWAAVRRGSLSSAPPPWRLFPRLLPQEMTEPILSPQVDSSIISVTYHHAGSPKARAGRGLRGHLLLLLLRHDRCCCCCWRRWD